MDLSLKTRSPLLKTNKWSAESFKKRNLNKLYTSARDTAMWHWLANTPFWQLSIDYNMDVLNIKFKKDCLYLGLQASKCDISHLQT